jgi:predicted DNA-binding protein
MAQITARMPERLVAELDAAARRLNRSRAEVLRQAAEAYLEDCEDLWIAADRLHDSTDQVLDWEEVRGELVGQDQE